MKAHNGFEDFTGQNMEERLENRASLLSLYFMSWIDYEMEKQKMSKKELAQQLGTSASYITQLFRGDKKANMNILARMENALGIKFSIHIKTSTTDILSEPLISLKSTRNENPTLKSGPSVHQAKSRPSKSG